MCTSERSWFLREIRFRLWPSPTRPLGLISPHPGRCRPKPCGPALGRAPPFGGPQVRTLERREGEASRRRGTGHSGSSRNGGTTTGKGVRGKETGAGGAGKKGPGRRWSCTSAPVPRLPTSLPPRRPPAAWPRTASNAET